MAMIRISPAMLAGIVGIAATCVLGCTNVSHGQDLMLGRAGSPDLVHAKMRRWEFFQVVQPEADPEPNGGGGYLATRLPQEVFAAARLDLADLRLVDARGEEVPYQLRVMRADASEATLEARRFNESLVDGKVFEVALDLGDSPREHNELEIATEGASFRRLVELEGGDDGKTWRFVTRRHLVRYPNDRVNSQPLDNRRVPYPASRFRYLRLRIHPDPLVDAPRGDSTPSGAASEAAPQATSGVAPGSPAGVASSGVAGATDGTGAAAAKPSFEIQSITVKSRVDIPEELVVWNVHQQSREPVRARNTVSSAWSLDLLAQRLPVDRLRVTLADTELARDYVVETAGPLRSDIGFSEVGSGTLSRRPGEPLAPLEVVFGERQAARVRLITLDFANRPPQIEHIEALAPARDVIFPATALAHQPLSLYYGNPKADAPNYDFARNLPAKLAKPPEACELSPRSSNPDYEPEPQPLTERAPWLIYVVLGVSSMVVAVVLADIGRKAIEAHDAAGTSSTAPQASGQK
ncbi:MAG: hypothetical protein ACKO38_15970 [Planctomycetota bacterium]